MYHLYNELQNDFDHKISITDLVSELEVIFKEQIRQVKFLLYAFPQKIVQLSDYITHRSERY